jgi:tetratricopeptide (TPR) repeat protein
LATAERLYRRHLGAAPGDFDALHMLGVACAQQRKFPEAERLMRRALAIRPDSPEALVNLGRLLIDLDRPRDAGASLGRAVALRPQDAEAHYNLGIAQRRMRQLAEAAASFETVLRLQPDNALALSNFAETLCDLDRHADAIALLDRLDRLKPDDPANLILKGRAYQETGALDQARAFFARAVAVTPVLAAAWLDLVSACGLAPDQLARLEALAGESRQPAEDRALLLFALGKAYEGLERYDEAFSCFLQGNRLKRSLAAYDEPALKAQVARLQRSFSRDLLEARARQGSTSGLPIFIVGYPRSGTTLVEQILASHPMVHGAGERDFMGDIASALHGPGNAEIGFPECLPLLPPETLRRAGDTYVAMLQGLAPTAPRITDKFLLNYYFLGLIRLILPQAPIIHVRREPMDSCLSCFATHFSGNLSFTYDLAELGRNYGLYLKTMALWRRVLPEGAMLEVDYEAVVGDLEGQARRIIAHCGLPWDERCLAFHRTRRSVRTASIVQVRQPIYRSSLARWRRYEKHLGPLLEALGSAAGGLEA